MKFTSLKKEFESNYIKSLPVFTHLNLTANEIKLIELVHSYQRERKTFYMNHEDIADYLVINRGKTKRKVVGNIIGTVKRKGYITTITTHNFNGKNGGSSTTIEVNEAFLESELHKIFNQKEETTETISLSNQEAKSEINSVLVNIETYEKNPEPDKVSRYDERLRIEQENIQWVKELNEMEDSVEQLEIFEIKHENDADAMLYKEIDNIVDFITLLRKLIRKDSFSAKKGAIQYLIDLENVKDLQYLKNAFKEIILKDISIKK